MICEITTLTNARRWNEMFIKNCENFIANPVTSILQFMTVLFYWFDIELINLLSSFTSMEDIIRHEALSALMTFL